LQIIALIKILYSHPAAVDSSKLAASSTALSKVEFLFSHHLLILIKTSDLFVDQHFLPLTKNWRGKRFLNFCALKILLSF